MSRCAASYDKVGWGKLKPWEFSSVYVKGTCGRAGTRLLAAVAVIIPALLLVIAVPIGSARAAIDMAAKVNVELVARTGSASGTAQDFLVREGGVLRSGDGLQLRLASDIEAYVYIIAYGSSHTAILLHPFSRRPGDALIRPGQREIIPEPGVFLPLDGREGLETLFTIGSDVPLTDIADLLSRMEEHGDDLRAITAMLRATFPLARRLSFKHIGARPLVGVATTAPRKSGTGQIQGPSASTQNTDGNPERVGGPSLLPPATGGWAVSSTKSFGTSAATSTGGTTPAAGAGAAAPESASAPAPEAMASVAGDAQASAPASAPASAAGSAPASSARRKAKEAAGIDEQQFRGILATLPGGGNADAPELTRKPFTEQGVLSAEGSRIRALEGAQLQSGASWPSSDGSTRKEIQN